ncbi:hypothetical protein GGI35DRAFT_307390 [Trichoderma velutinum]
MEPEFVWTTLPASAQGDSGLEAEHAARAASAGDRTLDDILPHWERSMTLTPKDALDQAPPVQQPDYPKYESMMQHWESFVNGDPPPEVHLYWKEGLAEAKKRFTLGPKPTNEVKKLVTQAIIHREKDLHLVKSKFFWVTRHNPIMEMDAYEIIPLALARLMGMGPPQDDEFSKTNPRPGLLWEHYFAPKIRQQRPDSMTLIYASNLVAAIRNVDLEDSDSLQAMWWNANAWYKKMEASLNADHYTEWRKAWEEEFPEVVAPPRITDAFMAEVEALMEAEFGCSETQEGEDEAAYGEETGQEASVLHAAPDMVPEGSLGGMEPFDMDWEDAIDMA